MLFNHRSRAVENGVPIHVFNIAVCVVSHGSTCRSFAHLGGFALLGLHGLTLLAVLPVADSD